MVRRLQQRFQITNRTLESKVIDKYPKACLAARSKNTSFFFHEECSCLASCVSNHQYDLGVKGLLEICIMLCNLNSSFIFGGECSYLAQ